MRLLLLILFVSFVLADEKRAEISDKNIEAKNEVKKSTEQPKSKTGKRDSSNQTSSFRINSNDEPFKPMLNSPAPFEAAASDTQQVYYDKNQVKTVEGAGKAKSDTNPQAANAYRVQYSQVPHQQHHQQQNKNHLRVAAKNVAIQQQNQPSILYATPQNPAYHYERIPQQQQQQLQQIQIPVPPPLPAQRGQQKQVQYLIAIPLSYLRQIQQQLVHQQQQEQPTHLQVFKGQQQPQQQQQQLQPIPVYSIGGPLARDNQGAYRPFHRFTPTAVNDVSTGTQHQTAPVALPLQQLVAASPAQPGYVTQHVQIPASVLLAALQSAQVQQQQQQHQQQRPVILSQNVYHHQQQQQQQQQEQPQIQLQLQPPIHQQHAQTQSPQLYYYQPQQQVQLKQSQPSPILTSPPVYAYHVNQLQQQQQQQQPTQQHQTFQHLTEQQQQHLNVGKQQQQQPHRIRGVRPTANFTPSQYDSSASVYENEEKEQLVALQAPTHTNLNAHTHTNAHSQQYIAQAPVAQQQHHHSAPAPARQVEQTQAPEAYDHIVHYNPQYVQHYQGQQQQQKLQPHQHHRLQIQPQQHAPLVEHLNNLPFSQGIHGPTPLPFLRLHPAAGVNPFYNLNMVSPSAIPQSFLSGSFQPPFTPLGTPSKVTSFTNVLLQPFVGHPSSFSTPEIGTAVSGNADSLPFIHQTGGEIRYGTHLYHPPTSATTFLSGNNKQQNSAVTPAHPAPRVLNTAGEAKVSASSAKAGTAIAVSPTVVKYP